ncbi:hypothetical protein [Spirillospora albida]|uniref:hypothetical protein n=1 Tax=Spirillospora albida TaxID=58123 RepID=UPI000AA766B8|nr:hypothetical protein [Spirillospora albida]
MTPTRSPDAAVAASSAVPDSGGDAAPVRKAGRFSVFVRGRWLLTIPGRIRTHVALTLAALLALLAVLTVAIGNARDSVQTIGHDAGPQVVATGALYFALSDMDAQVASILLIGRDHGLGIGRDRSLERYERRRTEAGRAAVQAAQLATHDPDLRRTVEEVLDGLGRYERLAGEAMLLDRQAGHPPGEPPAEVVDAYRQATDLMKVELLPKAYNITLDTGEKVRRTHETERSAILTGRAWVVVTGALLLALLVATQMYLARTFRRVLNPALVLATAGTLVLVAVATALLSAQAGHIARAKRDGFDPILSLSRARAIGHSAFADESRYLLDPGRADTYEQTYLDKSLSVLYLDMGTKPLNLANYHPAVDGTLARYRPGPGAPPFLGLFGDEARVSRDGREAAAFGRTLQAYRTVLANDRRMRELAARGDRAAALDLRMGRTSGAIRDFDAYDAALVALAGVHREAFDEAIAAANGGLRGWAAVPGAAAAAIALLIAVGVRPRLAEFR